MGYIISVVNNKGGVGKTLTTCNLADALGKKNKKILVIDIDPQCNTSTILLPRNTQIRKSLFEIIESNGKLEDLSGFIYATECNNVLVLPNITDTANLEPDLISNAPDSFFKLRNILREYANSTYDYTIIDCPPNMGSFVLCALYTSDFVIVPVKAGSAFSVEGLIRATKLIEEIKTKGNSDLKFLRLLINSVDKRTAISKAITGQLHNIFDENQVFKTQIPVNTAFEKAESMGETIFQNDATATGSRAFRALATELTSILGI